MRKRRRGDPNAPFKRGRPPRPRPEGPEMVALRQENAALREEIQKLQRQLKAARTQAQNERLIWLEPHVLNKLRALRGKGESYSDVILRLAAIGHESLNGS
jgi:hypothetical protein